MRVSYAAHCPQCDYTSQEFRFKISAQVVAEDHAIKSGHRAAGPVIFDKYCAGPILGPAT